MKPRIHTYILNGGGEVDVHKVFNKQHYIAVVDLQGRYPEKGHFAKDKGRKEYVVLIEGRVKLQINDTTESMKIRKGYLIRNNDIYHLNGKGKILVFVDDGKKLTGKTEIISSVKVK